MNEYGLSKELERYADAKIAEAKEKNCEVHNDLDKYRNHAMRVKVWDDVKVKLGELRKKYALEEEDDGL